MSNDKMREDFEERFPLPEGMRWCEIGEQYAGHKDFWLWTDRLNTWQASREALVIRLPKGVEPFGLLDPGEVEIEIENAGAKVKI